MVGTPQTAKAGGGLTDEIAEEVEMFVWRAVLEQPDVM